ncbi:hypothetical protein B0H10DRAFT_2429374 [Mycena sp. CBHHK59/15]|nr:hypothetical protein B0H10DRAFT_2429374 [Mycena sp. CBHHK59/15]
MPITDAHQLVDEFKKSGEFDKLRRELLADAQRSASFDAFTARIDEIARARIKSGQRAYTAPHLLHKELMQEVNRFPVIERFAADAPMLADARFSAGIRASVQRILREDRGQPPPLAETAHAPPAETASIGHPPPSQLPPAGEGDALPPVPRPRPQKPKSKWKSTPPRHLRTPCRRLRDPSLASKDPLLCTQNHNVSLYHCIVFW